MSQARENFFNLHDPTLGIARELAPGLTTRVLRGDQAMLSIVRCEATANGALHPPPAARGGVMRDSRATPFQAGGGTTASQGVVWRAAGNVPHTIEAGPEGCTVLDIFSPPRAAYRWPGAGFGTAEI